MTRRVDLNCDVGEGIADEEALLAHVSSANIACGFHAGDPATMRRTLILAATHGVAAGAHPGFRDAQGFGRRAIGVTPEQAYELVIYQVGALLAFGLASGVRIAHVKPHGALYTMAAADAALAEAISAAVHDLDPALMLFGLADSELLREGERAGLRTASEAFADRGYEPDGTLIARGTPGALVQDPEEAADRAVRMALEGRVTAHDGSSVEVRADTICVHGDSPNAVQIAAAVREGLALAGVTIAPPWTP